MVKPLSTGDGFDGGGQSYQTVSDAIAVSFLRSLGLLA
jgi:hypothetical protein